MNMAEREREEMQRQTISGKAGDAGENHLMAFVKAAGKREREEGTFLREKEPSSHFILAEHTDKTSVGGSS